MEGGAAIQFPRSRKFQATTSSFHFKWCFAKVVLTPKPPSHDGRLHILLEEIGLFDQAVIVDYAAYFQEVKKRHER